MKLLKKYTNISGFLDRFTIFELGKFHLRTHTINSVDKTTFLHNHPFSYCSIILQGGYEEHYIDNEQDTTIKVIQHKAPCIIFSNSKRFHRIDKIYGKTKTVFFAFGKSKWKAINLQEATQPDGVFKRIVNGKEVFCKRENDIWYRGSDNYQTALSETRHSIHQILN